MEEQEVTILLDDTITKTFIKCIDFYKLASSYVNCGENIDMFQDIKQEILNSILPNKNVQELKLQIFNYSIPVLLDAIDLFIIACGFFGKNEEVTDCHFIKGELVSLLSEYND